MKIKGRAISSAQETYVVIPRAGEDIILRLKTVDDFEDFNKLCPMPEPPRIKKPGQAEIMDTTDPEYKKEVNEWALKKLSWTLIKSLEDTEEIEWDMHEDIPLKKGEEAPETKEYNGLIMNDSDSWYHAFTQLSESFSSSEVDFIMQKFNMVQGLTNDKIKEATESFLAGQAKGPDED